MPIFGRPKAHESIEKHSEHAFLLMKLSEWLPSICRVTASSAPRQYHRFCECLRCSSCQCSLNEPSSRLARQREVSSIKKFKLESILLPAAHVNNVYHTSTREFRSASAALRKQSPKNFPFSSSVFLRSVNYRTHGLFSESTAVKFTACSLQQILLNRSHCD